MSEVELLTRIMDQLTSIQNRLDDIEKDTHRFNEHIGFVEETYSIVKAPVESILNTFTYLTGNKKQKHIELLKTPHLKLELQ
jgi:archaellum component FlaC